jgi:hypothetical protein
MELVIAVDGVTWCIEDEALDLRERGTLQITRASHVKPDAKGNWRADMGPSSGPGALQKPVAGVGGGEGVAYERH